MLADTELAIEAVTNEAVGGVHRAIFVDANLTAAQARLAWLMVIEKLLLSARIDRMTDVLREELGDRK